VENSRRRRGLTLVVLCVLCVLFRKLLLSTYESGVNMPQLASALERLGTETAYAVSAEAKALAAATGEKVFALHIGDENFPTAPEVIEVAKAAVDDGCTTYTPAAGIPALREAIAEHMSRERGLFADDGAEKPFYTSANVAVQPGGKPVIQKFLLATMNKGDGVLYPSPGYPIYESLVRFLGGVPLPYTYTTAPDGTLCLDMDVMRRQMSAGPARKLLLWNDMHNPTGYVASAEELAEIAAEAVKRDMWVLSDEAYFHVVYDKADFGRSIVQQPGMRERTVILMTMSKTWAMTGWRLGAAVGPTDAIDAVVQLATNDEGCVCNFTQVGAVAAFRDAEHPRTVAHSEGIVAELKRRRDRLLELVGTVPGFEAPGGQPPRSTFYMWVDVTKGFRFLGLPTGAGDPAAIGRDYETFRKRILTETHVAFCTRAHFGDALPDETRRYVRFAFSGIDIPDIEEAMAALRTFMTKMEASPPAEAEAKTTAVAAPQHPRRIDLGGRKPKVFCTRQMPDDAFKILGDLIDLEVWEDYDAPPRDVLLEKARECDGLISLLTDKIDEEFLAACPKLQVVSQLAVGFNNIDLEACTRHGVRVSNTPGVLTDTVVETAMALLLSCSRRVVEADAYVRKGDWKVSWHPLMLLGNDLNNKTLGVVGLGRIGGKLARVAKVIGARVLYFDSWQNKAMEAEGIVERVQDLDELCRQCDFISIHVNLTPETTHMFDEARLAKCKPNCILINTSRGPVVDQKALAKALREGTIAGAGLDVFEQEPISLDDELLQCKNAVVIPHLGSATLEARSAMSRLVGENMRAYWTGESMQQLVNTAVEE
jgi:lactate dehydrogenase-like 2-hydroxyacid dehydrogenase/aspartate/methionine/tyrosine aminotransferase